MSDQGKWERVKTVKRYLHPPKSAYFCTQWIDFKVLMAKFETQCAPVTNYAGYTSAGVRLLLGAALESVDFYQTEAIARDDGCPVHLMVNPLPEYTVSMESFCNVSTLFPSTYIRITLQNTQEHPVTDTLGLLLRTGPENYLTGHGCDGYEEYDGNVRNWGFAQSTWSWDGKDRLTDGQLFGMDLEDNGRIDFSWQGKEPGYPWHLRGLLRGTFTLEPGQSRSITLRMYYLDHNDRLEGYDAEREKAIRFWNGTLDQMEHIPGKPEHLGMVKNLTAQLLQMFSTYADEGYTAPRQGGMTRFFWSVEAMDFLIPMERMGGFREYTRHAYDFFFGHCQIKEGENAGQVVLQSGWGSTTGGALRACANHLLYGDREDYLRYRDAMYLAFTWMQRQRAKSYEQENLYKGLFPAMRGTDWPGEFQSWCMTDGHSLLAMRDMASAFEKYDDPCAREIRSAYEEYLGIMRNILATEVANYQGDPEELLLPNRLGIPQTDPPMGAYQGDGPAMLLLAGVMDPNSQEAKRVENYFRNRCCHQNGLTGLMCDGVLRHNKPRDPVAGHTWYLSTCDMRWFYTYLAQGRRDKAEQIIQGQMRYGMSEAYQMVERYADNAPYYAPYQPNASANGRLLSMLFDFYG